MNFLLLTPDDGLAAALDALLRTDGHQLVRLQALAEQPTPPHALLVDASLLPQGSAAEAQRWQAAAAQTPLLILGDAAGEWSAAEQLRADASADLIAQRLVLLGRAAEEASLQRWLNGELLLDLRRSTVLLDGRPVDLTPIEWRILAMLATQAARAVPRAELARLIGGDGGDASSNAVAVHLYNLRRKLGRHAIETIRGRGFRLHR